MYDRFAFTVRDREVAALLARNLAGTEIAEAINVSRDTANTHIHNLCEKTGTSGRGKLVKLLVLQL